jgi:hypothetical protein
MNHLTNLYKYKCEQLQEHINNLTRMLNEADAPLPTQGTPSLVPPSGIDPRMFDPNIMPPVDRNPNKYSPKWRERLPRDRDSIGGSFFFDPEGNTWQYLDGRWEVIRVVPGSSLWVGYPDAPGRLIPRTRTFPRWFDDDFWD